MAIREAGEEAQTFQGIQGIPRANAGSYLNLFSTACVTQHSGSAWAANQEALWYWPCRAR
jgi:hypothetical protein